MTSDDLALRAARREAELILRQKDLRQQTIRATLQLISALVLVLLVAFLGSQAAAQVEIPSRRQIEADMDISRIYNRLDKLENDLEKHRERLNTAKEDLRHIQGMGAALGVLLLMLQVGNLAHTLRGGKNGK